MLILLLGLFFLSTSALADSPLYIEELEELVYGPDRRLLDRLDDDDYSLRSELKVRLDEILARQTPEVQRSYANLVELKEMQRKQRNAHWQSRADAAGVGHIFKKIKNVQTDMTISEYDAEGRVKQLRYEMGLGSSSEEHRYSRYRRSVRP